jgi:hypothetical protein
VNNFLKTLVLSKFQWEKPLTWININILLIRIKLEIFDIDQKTIKNSSQISKRYFFLLFYLILFHFYPGVPEKLFYR